MEAFSSLKKDLANYRTLAYFDIDKETILYTDASPFGLGAILIQYHGDMPRVICYASRALTDVETRYMQTEKEALAIVWACERLHHYLFGVQFTLYTDHKPLEVIYGSKIKRTSLRIERWVLRLQCYDFKIVYVKGADNIADPLSRLIRVAKRPSELGQPSATLENAELYVRFTVLNSITAITARKVEKASHVDSELTHVRDALKTNNFANIPSDVPRIYQTIKDELCVLGQLLLRGNRIVIPLGLRDDMLRLGHEGHLGITGTKRNLRCRVWWPSMDADIEKYVRHCQGCQLTGPATCKDPIRVTDLPNGPWEELACDLLGPLPNGDHILVLVDYHSRWYEIKFLKTTTCSKVVEALKGCFDIFGLPVYLKTDNGPQFIALEFKQFMESMGVHHHLVTPRWPEANGEVERQNRSIMKRVRIAYSEGLDYKSEVRKYLVSYRNTPHSITGKSPAEMLFGRKIRTKLPQIQDIHNDEIECRDHDSELKHSMVESRNRGREPHTTKVGDMVLLRRENPSKIQTTFHHNPFKVIQVSGPMLALESGEGRIFRRNISHTRPYLPPSDAVVGAENSEEMSRVDERTTPEAVADPPPLSAPARTTAAEETETPELMTLPQPRSIDDDSVPEITARRSNRQSRPPSYLQDYVRQS